MAEEHVDPGEVVAAITQRFDLLELLASESRCLRDLRDDLDVSRSTAYKAVRELESIGAAVRSEGSVTLTPFGELLYEHYASFRADVERMASLRASIPETDSPSLDPAVFRDAEVVRASRHDPDRPIDVFEGLVRESDTFRGFSPVARSRYVALFRECVLEGDLEATIVTEPSAVEVLVTEHRGDLEDVIDAPDLTLLQTDGHLPFGLSCLGEPVERVVVALYDPPQRLSAILVGETPGAVAWGERTYASIAEGATVLDPDGG